ncbi:hypothetical protein PJK55_14660 [Exiguobacterium sp. MMG028]|uniref:hypothetical protein n=1 Tax=Exiguobacterium sp. MMG028 TaxID=3021979 RepID=UPI0022FEFDA6|nr:hypothetical protein [Exiguobacterium sp. MMG028]MDA5561978.1 hypothetical protein [Exiguobacterium sp. MMG028]
MTTDINHNPIIPSVVRKQYQRGMDLPELCRLYDTTEATLRPLIQGVERGERKDERTMLVKQVKELYEEERLGKYAIAEILGKHQKAIRDIVDEHGFKRKPKPKIKPKKVKIEVRSMKVAERHEMLAVKIKELQEQGLKNEEIMNELGIGTHLLYTVKNKYGLTKTTKPRKVDNPKQTKAPHLIYPLDQKEEPQVNEQESAQEAATTILKPEEQPELIGAPHEHKKPSTRIINRDKDVWAEYLTAHSQEIHDVAHDVEVVVEDGKLIERTTIAYTLERELTK